MIDKSKAKVFKCLIRKGENVEISEPSVQDTG
jgi:hypothetical protein